MRVEIRKATQEDAETIAELATALGYPSSGAEVLDRLAVTLDRPDHFVAVAEDSGGQVVGWVHACEELRIESDRKVEVAGLVVRERERGNGVGLMLLKSAEAWAAGIGVRRIRLRSNVLRERAHAFFARAGYSSTKTSHVFDKSLDR
jgi:N-acetylglutamate synthase-like GNAT family acetyltransferase